MFAPQKNAQALGYPRCLGLANVAESLLWNEGVIPFSTDRKDDGVCSGILFEYIEGLTEITKPAITPEVAADIMALLDTIHAANILHRDLENRAVWPDVGFGNLFIKESTGGTCNLSMDSGKRINLTWS